MDCCIYETDEEYKATLLVNILKKNKIWSFCVNRGIQNLYGDSKLFTGYDLIVGEIKVYVKEKDAGKARRIIDKTPLLKKQIRTIENDEIKKEAYFIQRSFAFSGLSFFIIPFFFNMDYVIYSFNKKIKARYVLLIANILCLVFSIILCINSFEFVKTIWKSNLFFTLAFSIGKGVELHNKKSKLKYLMFIPPILLIISYNIADQIYGISVF